MDAAQNSTPDIHAQLRAALAPASPHHAELVADPETGLQPYDAPFLRRWTIYQAEVFNPSKPVLFYVGFAPGEGAYLLTGEPENFVRLGQAEPVAITAADLAAHYGAAYLEVTRDMAELFYLVRSVDDVEFRPDLDEAEEAQRADLIQRYRPTIAPPAAEVAGGGFRVTVYAVREQALERHTLTVRQDGGIADEVTVLEEDLPLVYGL